MPPLLKIGLALTALGIVPLPADAQTPAVGFSADAVGFEDNATDTFADGFSLGWRFTVSSPIIVTDLGFFSDPSFDPGMPFNLVPLSPPPTGSYAFSQSHPVGIFDSSGTLLFSAAVPQSGGTADAGFVYIALTGGGQLLQPGTYDIAGLTGGQDPYVFAVQDSDGGPGLTVASPVTYLQDLYGQPGVDPMTGDFTLSHPTNTDDLGPGYFGPNFRFTQAGAVPEPSSLAPLAVGLLMLIGTAWRAQHSASPFRNKEKRNDK